MKIPILIVLFIVGSIVTAIQAMKYLELRQKRKQNRNKEDKK